MLACFPAEAEKTLLDHVVEMNDQFLTTMCRHARHHFEEKHRRLRRRAKEGLTVVLEAIDTLLSAKESGMDVLSQIRSRISGPRLREAVESCREFKRLEGCGYLDELCARYTGLRRYLPDFLNLPFEAAAGNEALMTAIGLLRQLDAEEIRHLPEDAPIGFIPEAWRASLYREDGRLERRVWVIGLSLAVRDALRAGGLFLAASRVFATQVISCSPREALYVLDGLLENDTILRPHEHYTDTHGFTEQLFGLCFLLGHSFMPRLRDAGRPAALQSGQGRGVGKVAATVSHRRRPGSDRRAVGAAGASGGEPEKSRGAGARRLAEVDERRAFRSGGEGIDGPGSNDQNNLHPALSS